ncbi:leucyl aminopeptidase [Desulfopila sp. IMCC35008]|uniref:leucyl aminopeptidase n=1 Tax=Desulfopila sp. IMCC35008 TaxID=2653858 RepID=UPI0013D6F028|nr:leucyl aminopeptidase [Desulfopila sp. IMCC35008]
MIHTEVVVSTEDPISFKGDLLVCFVASGRKDSLDCDKRILQVVYEIQQLGDFSAKENECILLYPSQHPKLLNSSAKRVLVIGLGEGKKKRSEAELAELFRLAGGTISSYCEKYKVSDMMISAGPDLGFNQAQLAESLIEGVLLGDYRFSRFKKKDEKEKPYVGIEKILVSAVGWKVKSTALRRAVKKGAYTAVSANEARNMANEPGNHWTATHFAEYAKTMADELNLKCKTLNKAEMSKLGMGGILAVNQGSSEPPKLVVLEHNPKNSKKTILLIGKGLTFDSGGVSLKPAAGMQDMKYDMCGGAAVLGAMRAIAADKPRIRVVAIVPATDNMAGSAALKPGDIIKHYNGLTSEIVNTDAEGRLILADALAYGIEKYNPDCVVDVATLTGAVIIGLGHHYTGLLSNDDKLAGRLLEAGDRAGEPVWRLPLGKEYSKQIESKVADIKNAGGRPGGTSTAAAYLEHFVGETPWAHLDIAGTAWDFTEKTYIPKGPSGIMVRTLVQLVRDWR